MLAWQCVKTIWFMGDSLLHHKTSVYISVHQTLKLVVGVASPPASLLLSLPQYPNRLSQSVPIQVMVANIRCGEILNDQLRSLQEDQAWTSLVENAQQHLVSTFGSQASNLLGSCLAGVLYATSRLQQCADVH